MTWRRAAKGAPPGETIAVQSFQIGDAEVDSEDEIDDFVTGSGAEVTANVIVSGGRSGSASAGIETGRPIGGAGSAASAGGSPLSGFGSAVGVGAIRRKAPIVLNGGDSTGGLIAGTGLTVVCALAGSPELVQMTVDPASMTLVQLKKAIARLAAIDYVPDGTAKDAWAGPGGTPEAPKFKTSSGTPIQVFVKTLTGKTLTIDTTTEATMTDFAEAVSAKSLVPAKVMRFIYAGKSIRIDESITLLGANIGKESTLHMLVGRPLAGSTSSPGGPSAGSPAFRAMRVALDLFTAEGAIPATTEADAKKLSALKLPGMADPARVLRLFAVARATDSAEAAGVPATTGTGEVFSGSSPGWFPLCVEQGLPSQPAADSAASSSSSSSSSSSGSSPAGAAAVAPRNAAQLVVPTTAAARSELTAILAVICSPSSLQDSAFDGILARLRSITQFPPASLALARLRESLPINESLRCALATGLWTAGRVLGVAEPQERPRAVLWHLLSKPSVCALQTSAGHAGPIDATLASTDSLEEGVRMSQDPAALVLLDPSKTDSGDRYADVSLKCAAANTRLVDPVRVDLTRDGGGGGAAISDGQRAFFGARVFSRSSALARIPGGSSYVAGSQWDSVTEAMLAPAPTLAMLVESVPSTVDSAFLWRPRGFSPAESAALAALVAGAHGGAEAAASSGAGGGGADSRAFVLSNATARAAFVQAAFGAGGALAHADAACGSPLDLCRPEAAAVAAAVRLPEELELAEAVVTDVYASPAVKELRFAVVPPEQLAAAPTPSMTFCDDGSFGVFRGYQPCSPLMLVFNPLTGSTDSVSHATLAAAIKSLPAVVAEMARVKSAGGSSSRPVKELCAVLIDSSNSMNSRGFAEEVDPFAEKDRRADALYTRLVVDATVTGFMKQVRARSASLSAAHKSAGRSVSARQVQEESLLFAAAKVAQEDHLVTAEERKATRTISGMPVPPPRPVASDEAARRAALDASALARLQTHPSLGTLRLVMRRAVSGGGRANEADVASVLQDAVPYALMDQRERMERRKTAMHKYRCSLGRWVAKALVVLAADPDGLFDSAAAEASVPGDNEAAAVAASASAPVGRSAVPPHAPAGAGSAAAASTATTLPSRPSMALPEDVAAEVAELATSAAKDAPLVRAYMTAKERIGEGAPPELCCELTGAFLTHPVRWEATGKVYQRQELEPLVADILGANRSVGRFSSGRAAGPSAGETEVELMDGTKTTLAKARSMKPDQAALDALGRFLREYPAGFKPVAAAGTAHSTPASAIPDGLEGITLLPLETGKDADDVLATREGCVRVLFRVQTGARFHDARSFTNFAAYVADGTTPEHLMARAKAAEGIDAASLPGQTTLSLGRSTFTSAPLAAHQPIKESLPRVSRTVSWFREAPADTGRRSSASPAAIMPVRFWPRMGSQASSKVKWVPEGMSGLDLKLLCWADSDFSRHEAPDQRSFWFNFTKSGDGWRSGHLLEEDAPLASKRSSLDMTKQPIGSMADEDEEGVNWGTGTPRESGPHGVIIRSEHYTPHDAPDRISRMLTVKELFSAFVNRLIAYDVPLELSLTSFGSSVNELCEFTPLFEDFRTRVTGMTPDGDTAMVDAVGAAITRLKARKAAENPDARLRILVLSDGRDTSSSTLTAVEAAQRLQAGDVTLDAVVIGDEVSDDLFALAKSTGGLFFHPASLEQSQRLVELELFLSTLERRDKPALDTVTNVAVFQRFKNRSIHHEDSCEEGCMPPMREHPEMATASADIGDAAAIAAAAAVAAQAAAEARQRKQEEEETAAATRASAGTPGARDGADAASAASAAAQAAADASAASAGLAGSDMAAAVSRIGMQASLGVRPIQRLRRIQRELAALASDPHPCVEVMMSRENPGFLKLLINGPESSPYEGGIWLALLELPPGFPRAAPSVRFQTPIKHVNVTPYGKMCHSLLSTGWTANVTLRTVIDCAYGLLLTPETDSPVDTVLAMQYNKEPGAYTMSVKEHTDRHATGTTMTQWKARLTATGKAAATARA